LAHDSGISLPTDCTEALLGTAGTVFFYTAPFRYPHTGCGLLFAHTLERFHGEAGVATPFDSGGLVKCFTRPDPAEPPKEFLARHELPVPDHRRYLALAMRALFHRPEDYIEGMEPHLPGPIGLTGGDQRRWTHEVRLPDQVVVRGHHLQAAFAPRARVIGNPAIKGFFKWCEAEGIDHISFDTPGRSDFEALQRECLAYIRQQLY